MEKEVRNIDIVSLNYREYRKQQDVAAKQLYSDVKAGIKSVEEKRVLEKQEELYALMNNPLVKIIATDFFRWWYNQKGGTNTDDAFDEYVTKNKSELKRLMKQLNITTP